MLANWVGSIKIVAYPRAWNNFCKIHYVCFCYVAASPLSSPASRLTYDNDPSMPHLWPHKFKPGVCNVSVEGKHGGVCVHGGLLPMLSDSAELLLVPKGWGRGAKLEKRRGDFHFSLLCFSLLLKSEKRTYFTSIKKIKVTDSRLCLNSFTTISLVLDVHTKKGQMPCTGL